jgi:hypothetical protein
MVFRLNKEKEAARERAEKEKGSNQDLAEVINPQSIKEAKENIKRSIFENANAKNNNHASIMYQEMVFKI